MYLRQANGRGFRTKASGSKTNILSSTPAYVLKFTMIHLRCAEIKKNIVVQCK